MSGCTGHVTFTLFSLGSGSYIFDLFVFLIRIPAESVIALLTA